MRRSTYSCVHTVSFTWLDAIPDTNSRNQGFRKNKKRHNKYGRVRAENSSEICTCLLLFSMFRSTGAFGFHLNCIWTVCSLIVWCCMFAVRTSPSWYSYKVISSLNFVFTLHGPILLSWFLKLMKYSYCLGTSYSSSSKVCIKSLEQFAWTRYTMSTYFIPFLH